MSHFLSLKISSKIDYIVYTGMYNFMKEIHIYIFSSERSLLHIDLRCFIIDKSWHVCDSDMQLVHTPSVSVVYIK